MPLVYPESAWRCHINYVDFVFRLDPSVIHLGAEDLVSNILSATLNVLFFLSFKRCFICIICILLYIRLQRATR